MTAMNLVRIIQPLIGSVLMYTPLILGLPVSLIWVMWGQGLIALLAWGPLGAALALGALVLADDRWVKRHGSHRQSLLVWILWLSIALPLLSGGFFLLADHLDTRRLENYRNQ